MLLLEGRLQDDLPALLNDLVVIRIFEPASKLRSLELLEQFFGIRHSRKAYYKIAPDCVDLKKTVEQKVACFADLHYSFNFDILFYDVTTLYFETFEEDGLHQNGFSKDDKSQQPQILIALMVSKEGFPVAYEVFWAIPSMGTPSSRLLKILSIEMALKNLPWWPTLR